MCVIIYQPQGATIPFATLLRAYSRNEDGWGLAARTPEGVIVRRDFGDDAAGTLLEAYAELRQYELVVHCRIGTSGALDLRNTHPFHVADDLFMFHNGMIDIDRSTDENMCDSYHVARALADQLDATNPGVALRDPEYVKALAKFAKTSRLAFIDTNGVVLVNEAEGAWLDGCWYSNDSAERDSETALAREYGSREAAFADLDEVEYGFRGRYYDGIVPRSYRVETPEDEDALHLDAVRLIGDFGKLDVDDIAERILDDPEIAAEAFSLLLQERAALRRAS